MGSAEATSDHQAGTISEKSVAGRGVSRLKRVLSKPMCTGMVSQCPVLIYELAIKENAFGKQNFLPAAIPPCAMILLDLANPEGWADLELG